MDWNPGAGQPNPEDSIGARVAAKNQAIREALAAAGKEQDPTVVAGFEDAWTAAEEVAGPGMGGKRKTRGGAKTVEAIKNLVSGVVNDVPGIAGKVDSALAAVINNVRGIAAVGTSVVILNHPTLIGNLAELSARVLQTGTDASITATWGDWGQAIVGVGRAIGVIGATVASQTVQGPVVPVAIATAIMAWRASQRADKSITNLIKEDAAAVSSVAARGVTGQIQEFQTGRKIATMEMFASQLKELGEIARTNKARGQGAAEISGLARNVPLMAVQGTPAGVGQVPGSANVGRLSTVARSLADVGEQRSGPMKRMATRNLKAGPYDATASRIKKEGGRKTKKAKKSKRRVTRRKPFPSARMPVFAY